MPHLSKKQTLHHRGKEMTRLETFADASFAFAITMLVISVGKIPQNSSDLILALKKVPAFALSFTSIIWFWVGHRKWSRRYGLEDNPSIILSMILIFIMLVYVYPLRLMFSSLFAWITSNWLPGEFFISSVSELTELFVIYGMGYFTLCGVLALLYRHALKKGATLELSPYETIKTNEEFFFWLIQGVTGLASALFALVFPLSIAVFAGFVYITLAITMPMASIYFDKKAKNGSS